jgi:hypothetical protein
MPACRRPTFLAPLRRVHPPRRNLAPASGLGTGVVVARAMGEPPDYCPRSPRWLPRPAAMGSRSAHNRPPFLPPLTTRN